VDFVHDRLSRGGSLRLLSVVDEFIRQCLCLRVDRSLKSEQTLEILFKDYGKPLYLRSDNGSEFIVRSLEHWLKEHGTKPLLIEPGSPWQNCPQSLSAGLTNVDVLQGKNVSPSMANCGMNA
jgi:putative transposase